MPLTLQDVERSELLWRCFECAVEPVLAVIWNKHQRYGWGSEDISFFESHIKRVDDLLDECATAIEQRRFIEAELRPGQGWLRQAREFSEVGSHPPAWGGHTWDNARRLSRSIEAEMGAFEQRQEMIRRLYDEANSVLKCILPI
jgi:biopolymer transport protein ExbB/TolQ